MNYLASHNIERISSVAEKLSTLQLHLKNERCSKLDKLDNVIATTGDKLLEYSEECHNRFGNIREQLSKLYQQIEQQNQYFDSVYEEKMQYLKLLEEKVVEKFNEEAKFRKETEKRSVLLIEERFSYLMNELAKERKNRNESMDNFQKIIENDIPKITEGLKEEQNEMIEMDNMLNKKITDETQRLVSTVMNEKKAREETEEALLEMLKAMINAMKNQLETERKERQTTQEYLIGLLDDMCNKIVKANDII